MEDTPFYNMYEVKTTNVEGGLAGNTESYDDDEDPAMATRLDRKVPMPKEIDNYVNASLMLPD